MIRNKILLSVLACLFYSCQGGLVTPTAGVARQQSPSASVPSFSSTDSISPTVTGSRVQPSSTSNAFTQTATPSIAPDAWVDAPVVPAAVSQRVRQIYALGQSLGNDPNAFSKIGDCDTSSDWFLDDFDGPATNYSLGANTNLKAVIAQFHGSYSRTSIAARQGFVAASVLSPIWSDPAQCQADETPLACEVRIHRPSFAFILLGTNDFNHQSEFEPNMRLILNYLIARGVVPILATKADDLEGDESINATIARLAAEYDLPLWNFWKAVQPLPDHGLQPDHSHLTWAANQFDNNNSMQSAWPWRNLTALQVLDVVWRGASGQP